MILCERCQKPAAERPDRTVRFCSIACANKSRRKHFPKACPVCGRHFQPPRSHAGQKYCSTACRDIGRITSERRPCAECGLSVTRSRNRVNRMVRSFCSRKCNREWRKKNAPRGAAHPQHVEHLFLPCDTCGTIVERWPSHRQKRNFCGVSCRIEWQRRSGYSSGPASGAWKGGYQEYYGLNWRAQRRGARHRDGYQCQRCAVTEAALGRHLDVHHVRPFREFGGDFMAANRLSNLISLCNRCHLIVEHAIHHAAQGTARRGRAARRSSRGEVVVS